jgi:Family of unknown function (DUF5681)
MKRPTKYRSKSSKSRIPGEVGYRRPPKHTRFKPGQSGNPSGRPGHKASTKASGQSVGALLSKILKEKLKLREGERLLTVSKIDAALRSIVAKAIKGDPKSFHLIEQLIAAYVSERGELAAQPQQGTSRIEVIFVRPDGRRRALEDEEE